MKYYTLVGPLKNEKFRSQGRRKARRRMNQRETRKLDALGVNCVGDDTDGGSAIACDSQLQ